MDRARHMVVERDLVRTAFDHLTVDAFMALPFEALGPTKALLKRFLSDEAWGRAEDDALASAVGSGEGWWRRPLDADLSLEYGWEQGRFVIRVEGEDADDGVAGNEVGPGRAQRDIDPLAATFDGPVVPEATPNPRTIRFHVGAIHDGPSRWYESAEAAAGDSGAHRLFAEFPDVANVLVGPDFVAVGLRRPDRWEPLLVDVLAAVTEEFASPAAATPAGTDGPRRVMGGPAGAGAAVVAGPSTAPPAGAVAERATDRGPRLSRLEQAWRDLGSLRPAEPEDLARVRAAAHGDVAAHRQVAASLLREADAEVAAGEWARLAADPVRGVRRATIDAVVDVGREELRPLLEAALGDADAWVRWKALRGLAELGAAPSRDAIAGCSHDSDFRVRLEAAAALRAAG